MSRQLIAHGAPQHSHRRLHSARIAIAAITITAGGYGAVQGLGLDADPRQSETRPATAGVIPQAQAMQEMRDAIAGQYGTHPPMNANSRAQALGEMRDTVANLYGDSRPMRLGRR
ncbi:MAG: hypothetical protein ABI611_21195 [Solirubrobacteraceae bacterium]